MRLISTALLCASLGLPVSLQAAMLDSNWTEATVSTDGSVHTGLAWAPDGSDRLFVIEKGGRVRIMSGLTSTGTASWSTFATMTPIYTESECGLIGIAFDPDYVSNRYVYFFVTVSSGEQQIIRYRDNANLGDQRTVVMPGLPTVGNNHDGGGIGFGADGKLYWSIGDLGNGTGVDANLTSLASKVGRANRDGSLPTGNPFDDGAGPNNNYIFARGMRNPFTMQFQPATGLMWLNVVGTSYEQIFVVTSGDHGGYNDFENNQPAPTPSNQYITPRIVYRTNNSETRTFSGANPPTRSGGVATFTTTANHGYRVGGNISISGVADASFNDAPGADQYVASVPSATTFTVVQPGPDATSSGGQSVTLNQGGSLTGGVFFDSSAAPPDYRGNFFYGDYNSGRLMRARINPTTNAVTRVDYWASGHSGQVDVDVGPDGALYYVQVNVNNIVRARYNASSQGLIVSRQNVRVDEDGEAAFAVSLAQAPVSNVTVDVARTAGDADVQVVDGDELVFTPANWNRPQVVRIGAAIDGDAVDDTATVSVSASGLTEVPVTVRVLDLIEGTDIADLSISVTDNATTVLPGGTLTYTIAATNAGPDAVTGATVADEFPSELTCAWTCATTGGGTCNAGASGNINDVVNLPVGATVNYTANDNVSTGANGTISNTATVTAPASVSDPDLDDNTDIDTTGVLGSLIFADGFEP